MRRRDASEEGRERFRRRDYDAEVRLVCASGGIGTTAMMAYKAAGDDRAESRCQEGADQPALGFRLHGLLNRGVIDNQHPKRYP
jgi:hypothetical protein